MALELLAGVTSKSDVEVTRLQLAAMIRIPVRDADLVAAHRLFELMGRSHGIGWPDCIIASTAVRLSLPLATLNRKHFVIVPHLRTIVPY